MIKLPREIHTYNFINNIDVNKNKTNHISQEFLWSQILSELSFSKLNLKVKALIIFLCNLYPALEKYNRTQIIIT